MCKISSCFIFCSPSSCLIVKHTVFSNFVKIQGVPEKALVSVQRLISPQVISFHLNPKSPGLSKSIPEKIESVCYPNTRLGIIVSQIFTAEGGPAVFKQTQVPKSFAQLTL